MSSSPYITNGSTDPQNTPYTTPNTLLGSAKRGSTGAATSFPGVFEQTLYSDDAGDGDAHGHGGSSQKQKRRQTQTHASGPKQDTATAALTSGVPHTKKPRHATLSTGSRIPAVDPKKWHTSSSEKAKGKNKL